MHFDTLQPEVILQTLTAQGFRPTGGLRPLNSYENRVYECEIDDGPPVVAKFYRPGRWDRAAIVDEHRFIAAALAIEMPVVGALPLHTPIAECATVGEAHGYRFACYPKFRGRERDELTLDERRWIGRLLGRLHNLGATLSLPHRIALTPQTYGEASIEWILRQTFLPDDLRRTLEHLLHQTLALVAPAFPAALAVQPIHGDCHLGNILWNADGAHLVDFDDACIGPPVQDLWMLIHGDPDERRQQLDALLEGYELFRPFDRATLRLIEPLRTLRMLRHAAWIGQRYHEPLFQRVFPYYEQRKYWEEFSLTLREQIATLQDQRDGGYNR